jgi:hypothetical protein
MKTIIARIELYLEVLQVIIEETSDWRDNAK